MLKRIKEFERLDIKLFVVICVLICIGLLILASASSYLSLNRYDDSNYLLFRQMGFAVFGIILMYIISRIDYRLYQNKKLAYTGYIVVLLLMFAVLIPGIGVDVKGAKRWIGIGELLQFQPSEIMKIMLVIAASAYISNNYKKITNIFGYMIPILMFIGIVVAMYVQEHLSGTVIMFAGLSAVIFASGIKINYKIVGIGVFIVGVFLYVFITGSEFRMKRVQGFLNPEEDISGSNWQISQSLYALRNRLSIWTGIWSK